MPWIGPSFPKQVYSMSIIVSFTKITAIRIHFPWLVKHHLLVLVSFFLWQHQVTKSVSIWLVFIPYFTQQGVNQEDILMESFSQIILAFGHDFREWSWLLVNVRGPNPL